MDKTKDTKIQKEDKKEDKKEEVQEEKFDAFVEIRKQLIVLERAVADKDTKTCGVVARNYKRIREELSLKDVGLVYDYYMPDLSSKLNLPKYDPDMVKIDHEEKLHCTYERAQKLASGVEAR